MWEASGIAVSTLKGCINISTAHLRPTLCD